MTGAVVTISPSCFPTPHLALPTNDTAETARIGEHAEDQAAQAAQAVALIRDGWARARRTVDRVETLVTAYETVNAWRYELAVRHKWGIKSDYRCPTIRTDLFCSPITNADPQIDRIGLVAAQREGAVWDEAARTYVGGRETPASRVLTRYGAQAQARMDREAPGRDILHNVVTLPHSRRLNGNTLIRGRAAIERAEHLAADLIRRGGSNVRVDVGGDPMYALSADAGPRNVMLCEALTLLATAEPGDPAALWEAAYLLYQAPVTKQGSDSVTRVFLVAVGAALLNAPPVLPHDVDLACVVLGQPAALDYLTGGDRR